MIDGGGPAGLAGAALRRIHILGAEATGKTTLSRRIGAILKVPVHNLDGIAWVIHDSMTEFEVLDPKFQPSAPVTPRSHAECLQLATALAETPTWITEGKYVGWTAPLLERSDLIVFLDHVTTRTAVRRIVARAARSAIREARRQRGARRFFRPRDYAKHAGELVAQLRARIGSAADSQGPQATKREGYLEELKPFSAKVVHIRRGADLDALLTRLSSPGPGFVDREES